MSDKSVGLLLALMLVLALWAAGAPWWLAIAIILAPVALGVIGGLIMLVVLLVMTPIRAREAELARHARRKPGRYVRGAWVAHPVGQMSDQAAADILADDDDD